VEADARFTQLGAVLANAGRNLGESRAAARPGDASLTLTTLSGFDNRALLPPTIPSLRNEDLLMGKVAQLAYPHSVMLDFPWALLHFRVPPKQWNALDDALPFRQDLPHFILEEVESAATRCMAESPHARLRMLAATLRDLADAPDALLRERLEHQLLDTRARHRFALERQLGSKRAAPPYWRNDVEALLKHRSLSMTAADVAHALASVDDVRTMLGNYARALDAWVDIWNYCRQTRASVDPDREVATYHARPRAPCSRRFGRPMRPKQLLESPRVTRDVEQRLNEAVGAKPGPVTRQEIGLARQLERQDLVRLERIGDQFRQADRPEMAAGDAAGERLSGTSDYRQAREQGVVGRRMGIARKRVEEKICNAVAAQMLVEWQARCENQALRRDVAPARFLPQIVAACRIRFQQP
jgi:hypothetical protein